MATTIVAWPWRATSASSRRAPVAFAAIWARKSPAVSCFERICARISRKTSSTIRPASTTFTGGMMHALLEHLTERTDRRRCAAADVDVMGEVRDVPEQLAAGEDGRDQADVVQVHAAREGIVGDDHVAGAEVRGPVAPDRLRHLLHHRAEVHRLGEALRDGPELGVEECAREVGARLDVRRVGTAAQGQDHLVRRRDERVPDHLERDRIDVALTRAAPLSPPRPAAPGDVHAVDVPGSLDAHLVLEHVAHHARRGRAPRAGRSRRRRRCGS